MTNTDRYFNPQTYIPLLVAALVWIVVSTFFIKLNNDLGAFYIYAFTLLPPSFFTLYFLRVKKMNVSDIVMGIILVDFFVLLATYSLTFGIG